MLVWVTLIAFGVCIAVMANRIRKMQHALVIHSIIIRKYLPIHEEDLAGMADEMVKAYNSGHL